MDEKKGIQFRGGEFKLENEDSVHVSLAIYNSGVIADTSSSTTHSEAFLKDAMDTIVEGYNLPAYGGIIRSKAYVSELYVRNRETTEWFKSKATSFCEEA
jgi:hypothetical protein